jgi:hypothetical protein
VRIFLGGDYQFLCMNYGHGGACSQDFCLFCTATLKDKADSPSDVTEMWGLGQKSKTMADLFQHTGVDPIFPIEPEYVSPLPLHITLGLTKDYAIMFRDEVCSELT